MRTFLFACWLLLCALSLGHAQITYYVDGTLGADCTTGNYSIASRNCSGSDGNAWNTISEGLAALSAGDTLYVRQGTYASSMSLFNVIGTETLPILISGYPGDARPLLVPGSANESIVTINTTSELNTWITIKEINLDGINQPENVHGIANWTAHNTFENMVIDNASRNAVQSFTDYGTFRNLHILNCGRIQPSTDTVDTKGVGFLIAGQTGFYTGSFNLVENNIIDGCRAGGGTTQYETGAHDNVIRNNIIRNGGTFSPHTWPGEPFSPTAATGWNIGQSQTNVHFYNNIVYNIGAMVAGQADCLLFWGGASNNFVYNNTCYDTDIGIIMDGSGNLVQNNILSSMNTTISGTQTGHTISNNLLNPTMADVVTNHTAGDFTLKTGSSAIDTGTDLSALTDPLTSQPYGADFLAVSRPQGAGWDIGAYEFVQAGLAFLADPSALSLSGNTVLTLLGNPSALSLSGNAAFTPLGNPSGLSLSGNSALTFLNNPSGLTLP